MIKLQLCKNFIRIKKYRDINEYQNILGVTIKFLETLIGCQTVTSIARPVSSVTAFSLEHKWQSLIHLTRQIWHLETFNYSKKIKIAIKIYRFSNIPLKSCLKQYR